MDNRVDLQLTNESPSHTGDDCAYFSIQRRCFDFVSGTVPLKISGRSRFSAQARRELSPRGRIEDHTGGREFSAKPFARRSQCWNPVDRFVNVARKKKTKSASLSVEISFPAPDNQFRQRQ